MKKNQLEFNMEGILKKFYEKVDINSISKYIILSI